MLIDKVGSEKPHIKSSKRSKKASISSKSKKSANKLMLKSMDVIAGGLNSKNNSSFNNSTSRDITIFNAKKTSPNAGILPK